MSYLEVAVGRTGRAVVLVQYFGWDDVSISDDWLPEDMAGRVVDVLCRRYDPETTGRTTDVCDPTNGQGAFQRSGRRPYQKYPNEFCDVGFQGAGQQDGKRALCRVSGKRPVRSLQFTDCGRYGNPFRPEDFAAGGQALRLEGQEFPVVLEVYFLQGLEILRAD